MSKSFKNTFAALAFLTVPFLFGQESMAQGLDSIKVVAPGASVKEVSNQFSFTEGPAISKNGDIYFTDQPNNKIWKYSTDGQLSVFMDDAGRSNGLFFDRKGNLIACADEKNELWSISPDKKVTVLLTDFKGHKLNGPNDVWVDFKGGIYFTDPYYQRDYWTRKASEIDGERVYYLPKGAKEAIVVDSTILKPNGLVGTADGKYLFVADIKDNKTYKYQINKDGTLSNRQLFVNQGSDGMTLDKEGNLYLAGRGITVYDKNGKRLGNIPITDAWVANVSFAGKDRKTLFVTASKGVYTLQMNVKGIE